MLRKSEFVYERTEISDPLHEDIIVFHIFGNDVCSTTIKRTHCYSFKETLSIFTFLSVTALFLKHFSFKEEFREMRPLCT